MKVKIAGIDRKVFREKNDEAISKTTIETKIKLMTRIL